MKQAELKTLPISEIRLDVENPRIKQFLEFYKAIHYPVPKIFHMPHDISINRFRDRI